MVWTTSLNPIRSFPAYAGPYSVGSLDLELPTSELETSHSGPDAEIATVAFRIFYPCENGSKKRRPVRWLPDPQRPSFSAFASFLGAGPALSGAISYLAPHLYYITIPVMRNAPMLKPKNSSGKWPVLVFSHGLGGNRNTYSHLLGSLASHGMVVVAMEHRDASAPISFVRATKTTEPRTIRYASHSHTPSPTVYSARDRQLKMRLWEISLVHAALLKIDSGEKLTTLGCREAGSTSVALSGLAHALDIHTPGSITWAGHSFGAATTIQFVKSVYWRCPNPAVEGYVPLYAPPSDSQLVHQITPHSRIVVLDLWAMPLQSSYTAWLSEKPMPSYDSTYHSAPGGDTLLAILSEAFFKWRANLNDTRRALAPPASGFAKPRFFYPLHSAHLSQSDFGILFPWFTRKIFGAMEPERVVRLNSRAILQTLRTCGIDVADTTHIDAEEALESKIDPGSDVETKNGMGEGSIDGSRRDWKILAADGNVRGWINVSTEAEAGDESDGSSTDAASHKATEKSPESAIVEGEMLTELTKGGPVLS
ncbi:MAG: hypothetical protein Q9165_000508 [Trypethelium subeluteriae]